MTYLNHAGTSWPKPAPVRTAVSEALQTSPETWATAFEAAHRRVGRAFGLPAPERLLLTPGCTTALALAVTDHPWQRGERILVSAMEHHALRRPVDLLAQRGIETTEIPRGPDGPLDLGRLERELERGRVRLVAMSAACNVTGELLPAKEVVALAHEHGALCLLDGAQIAGWVPMDLPALGVDLFAFAGHKGLQAPWGIGGLYVAPHVELSSPSAACELPVGGVAASCPTMPGYCDAGSVDRAALAGLAAALDWLEDPEQVNRLQRARSQIDQVAGALEESGPVRLHGARPCEARLPTIAFTIDGRSNHDIAAAFQSRGIAVASGLQCAPRAHEALGTAPGGAIRLSAGPSTGREEIEQALAVISQL